MSEEEAPRMVRFDRRSGTLPRCDPQSQANHPRRVVCATIALAAACADECSPPLTS
jgi:hypothetical protein